MTDVEMRRRIPRQARAEATVEIILEAAAQLLERSGEAGFNTNALAERAGVSVGTIYRYFPHKRAILLALARREMEATNAAFAAQARGETQDLAPDRAMIRTFLRAFGGHTKARQAAVRALLANTEPAELAAGHAPVEAGLSGLSRVQAFVMTRAIHGAMRAAVMEGADFLHSREFEDELVRLARSYLKTLAAPVRARPRP